MEAMSTKPFVEITEQPHPKAFKFRSPDEDQSDRCLIRGINTAARNQTFPTIRVRGYQGRAKVVVSCVTKDGPRHKPHPHYLVGENCENGVCTIKIKGETINYSFNSLHIHCVMMEEVTESLQQREELEIDPFHTGFTHANDPGSIDLNAVRLCFEVFIKYKDSGRYGTPLTPIVSDVIYDKKSIGRSYQLQQKIKFQIQSSAYSMPSVQDIDHDMDEPMSPKPFVEITEQPHPKAVRFRYEDDEKSAASIPGANTAGANKTFPTIRVHGYRGRAKVVVSCVTPDGPAHKSHPHSLIGEDCEKGVCTINMKSETTSYSFDDLRIQCVKAENITKALRRREKLLVDPFQTGFSHAKEPDSIDMSAIRLCFQVFLEDEETGYFTKLLRPVVSDVICDKKAKSEVVDGELSDLSATMCGVDVVGKDTKESITLKPFVEITEQPHPKTTQFGSEDEENSTAPIPGANKSFPTIQVHGYRGRAKVVVSCVTKESPQHKPHPQKLVGENCEKGVCTIGMSSDTMSYSFDDLRIQSVKAENITKALRRREKLLVDPFRTGFSHAKEPDSIDMSAIRLCFQVFLEDEETGYFTQPLRPVVSDVIYDISAMNDGLDFENDIEMSMADNDPARTVGVYAPKPFIEITEQPHPNAVRFRYLCEGRSKGSIPGINSTARNKTFPTIRLHGYRGQAEVVVSCVTEDGPNHKPHPNNLHCKNCNKGICRVVLNSAESYSFDNLGIQWEQVAESLKQRASYGVDPFRTGFAHASEPNSINMDAVRLCFQVFLENEKTGHFTEQLAPVVSNVIYDKKPTIEETILRKPFAEITEQPHPEALELHFMGDERSRTPIPGANSTPDNKTFPAIQVHGYQGQAKIIVSCVTIDAPPYKPHPHNLVGNACLDTGILTVVKDRDNSSYSFDNLRVQCVKVEEAAQSLLQRYCKSVDPFDTGFRHANRPDLIDLTAVRLCFQVFLEDEGTGRFTEPLKPLVSNVIYIRKANSEEIDSPMSDISVSEPFVEITEQPHPRTLRLRYEDEGQLVAPIVGANTATANKTFPTIRLQGYQGRAKVIVSCVTKDDRKPHPHNLVGDNCEKGVCTIEMNDETMSYSFNNLRVHCVKMEEVSGSLQQREQLQIDPFGTGFSHAKDPGSIDLNSVRLCFQVFIEGKDSLTPIVSDVIYYKITREPQRVRCRTSSSESSSSSSSSSESEDLD